MLTSFGWCLGQVLHLQAVVVMAPLTAREHLLRNLLHGQIRISIRFATECSAKYEQCAGWPNLIAQLLQLIRIKMRGGHVEEVTFRGTAMLPIDRIARQIVESLQLAERLCEHC